MSLCWGAELDVWELWLWDRCHRIFSNFREVQIGEAKEAKCKSDKSDSYHRDDDRPFNMGFLSRNTGCMVRFRFAHHRKTDSSYYVVFHRWGMSLYTWHEKVYWQIVFVCNHIPFRLWFCIRYSFLAAFNRCIQPNECHVVSGVGYSFDLDMRSRKNSSMR